MLTTYPAPSVDELRTRRVVLCLACLPRWWWMIPFGLAPRTEEVGETCPCGNTSVRMDPDAEVHQALNPGHVVYGIRVVDRAERAGRGTWAVVRECFATG